MDQSTSHKKAFDRLLSEIDGDKILLTSHADVLLNYATTGDYQGKSIMANLIPECAWNWPAYDEQIGIATYKTRCGWFLRRLGAYAFTIASIDRMNEASVIGINIKAQFLSGNPKDTPLECINKHGKIFELIELNNYAEIPPCKRLSCSCGISPKVSGFNGAEYSNKVSHPSGRAWTNEELRAQAEEFAKRKGLSLGKGLPRPSSFTMLRARLKYWIINKL